MCRSAFKLAGQVWRLVEDTERNAKAIEAMRDELDTIWRALEGLAFEMRRNAENDGHEREKLALRLENELLKFERRLPPPRKGA
jgi:hypothetical protein